MSEVYEYTILEHLLCYFYNGDVDNLTDDEIEQLNDFEASILDGGGYMTISHIEGANSFGRCEVLSVWGDVIDVEINVYS